jgi:hypothetical protein
MIAGAAYGFSVPAKQHRKAYVLYALIENPHQKIEQGKKGYLVHEQNSVTQLSTLSLDFKRMACD